MTVAASSWTGTSRSEPPKPPTGVRRGSQMTASRTGFLLVGPRPSERPAHVVGSVPGGTAGPAGTLRGRSGDALVAVLGLDLLGAQEPPETGDLQGAHDGTRRGEDAHGDLLLAGTAVGRGQHAQPRGIEEGDGAQVDDQLAGRAVEDAVQVALEDG